MHRSCALRRLALALIAALAAPAALAQSSGPGVSQNIHDYVTSNLHDLTVHVKKGSYNQSAGEKISDEFGLLYKLAGSGSLRYMQPNQIRVDGRIADMPGTFIMDGMIQRIRVGPIHKNLDQSRAPGRVSTLLDLGLISDFYLSHAQAHFEGVKAANGTACAVFRFTYPGDLHDASSRRVWIDPATKITVRREEINQDGSERAVFLYQNPVQAAPGVWVPSRIEADNAQGETVGVLLLQNIRGNQGLSPDLFK